MIKFMIVWLVVKGFVLEKRLKLIQKWNIVFNGNEKGVSIVINLMEKLRKL